MAAEASKDYSSQLSDITGYAKTYETGVQNIKTAEDNLQQAEADLALLHKQGWGAGSKQIVDANQKVRDMNDALYDARKAARDATNEMIAGFLQVQLAADGTFTEDDMNKVINYRLAMGLLTQEEYNAALQALAIAQNIADIPSDKHVKIDVDYNYPPVLPGPCCFLAGTRILMADGSEKSIEKIEIGDTVLGIVDEQNAPVPVLELIHKIREGYFSIQFVNGHILNLTNDHPLLTRQGWKSIIPEATKRAYPDLEMAGKMEGGDEILRADGSYESIFEIIYHAGAVQTHTLMVGGQHQFYAEGFRTHNACTQGYAEGGSGVVPPGYPNDSYMIGLSSGEMFTVAPAGSRTYNYNYFGGNSIPADNREILRALERLPDLIGTELDKRAK